MDRLMDTRRLALLLALSRLGSMQKVAEAFSLTTSTVSQQIAALAREAGEQLIEPDGWRVRLTPAGRRLADHAVAILAAVDAARLDLDPHAEPAGTVRVGGFATGRHDDMCVRRVRNAMSDSTPTPSKIRSTAPIPSTFAPLRDLAEAITRGRNHTDTVGRTYVSASATIC
jgi:DNA-binding MarR family transcriptional regulator